jgi:hypothetical protein
MCDLYEEKARERYPQLDKGKIVDFKNLKNSRGLQTFLQTTRISWSFNILPKSSLDFRRPDVTSEDLAGSQRT